MRIPKTVLEDPADIELEGKGQVLEFLHINRYVPDKRTCKTERKDIRLEK
jgi:hypothetical protein